MDTGNDQSPIGAKFGPLIYDSDQGPPIDLTGEDLNYHEQDHYPLFYLTLSKESQGAGEGPSEEGFGFKVVLWSKSQEGIWSASLVEPLVAKPCKVGQWQQWSFHIKVGMDGTQTLDIWIDGQKVFELPSENIDGQDWPHILQYPDPVNQENPGTAPAQRMKSVSLYLENQSGGEDNSPFAMNYDNFVAMNFKNAQGQQDADSESLYLGKLNDAIHVIAGFYPMGVNMSNFTAGEGTPVLNIQGIENPTVPISLDSYPDYNEATYLEASSNFPAVLDATLINTDHVTNQSVYDAENPWDPTVIAVRAVASVRGSSILKAQFGLMTDGENTVYSPSAIALESEQKFKIISNIFHGPDGGGNISWSPNALNNATLSLRYIGSPPISFKDIKWLKSIFLQSGYCHECFLSFSKNLSIGNHLLENPELHVLQARLHTLLGVISKNLNFFSL